MAYRLEWLPHWGHQRQQPLASRTEFLAVSIHPRGCTRNRIGQAAEPALGLVQLWAVPNTPDSAYCPAGLPACQLCLLHDARIVWDLQWCPDAEHWLAPPPAAAAAPAARRGGRGAGASAGGIANGDALDTVSDGPLASLGVLAMVLGDGSTQVGALGAMLHTYELSDYTCDCCTLCWIRSFTDARLTVPVIGRLPRPPPDTQCKFIAC